MYFNDFVQKLNVTLQRGGKEKAEEAGGGPKLPVLIVVCPTCHVLFMDQFQYCMLKAAPI
jgi:hypothetical protein